MADLSVFKNFKVEDVQTLPGNSGLLIPVRDKVRGATLRFHPDATGKLILTSKTWALEGDLKGDDGKTLWVFADVDWGTTDLIGEYVAAAGLLDNKDKTPKPKTSYYASAYVLEDDQYPHNAGRDMILPFTKSIYDKIIGARSGRKKFEPFDVYEGADFNYERDSAKGTKTYDGCSFASPSDFTSRVALETLVEHMPVLDKDVKRLDETEQRELLESRFAGYAEYFAELNRDGA